MKKILVPVDFSEVSKKAAAFAVDLAEKSNAEIIFLHSVHFNYYSDFPHAPGVNLQAMLDEVTASVQGDMDKFVAGLGTDVKIDSRLSSYHLLEAVKDTVKEENVGLVVLGTEGTSGWSEFLVGSNTERIVRWVECPVIAVPASATFDGIDKILVPIDLREIQDEFMENLRKLQLLFQAEIEFLWVKTPHNIENDEQVSSEFGDVLKSFNFKDATFTIARNVFPSDGILEHAEACGANMLAMATHARRGITHWLSGSITEDTVNHIKLPVWTFKLDKKAKNKEMVSFKDAEGVPEYKKIEVLAE